MTARTYGETKNCAGCRYWSETLAQSNRDGVIEAYCLDQQSPNRNKYTEGRQSCCDFAAGFIGAVDSPGFDGTEYQELEDNS